MPKVVLAHSLDELPLTVTTAAEQLDVAPSTLRTWERRYGLGPSARTVGAHRRYTAMDMARLRAMTSLIDRGVPTCDAARQALAATPQDLDIDMNVDVSVSGLQKAACSNDDYVVRSIIDQAIAHDGLVHAWMHVIEPAFTQVSTQPMCVPAGTAPMLMLQTEIMRAISGVEAEAPRPQAGTDVVVVTETSRELIGAHVLAAALRWERVVSRVLSAPADALGDSLNHALEHCHPKAVIMINPREGHESIVTALQRNAQVPIFLVGSHAPCILSPYVTRLHTISAVVAEITEVVMRAENGAEPAQVPASTR